jgi:hypothetical protein
MIGMSRFERLRQRYLMRFRISPGAKIAVAADLTKAGFRAMFSIECTALLRTSLGTPIFFR